MKRKSLVGLLFIAPLMLGIVVFLLYPMVEALRLSFYKTNFIETKFLGINNLQVCIRFKGFLYVPLEYIYHAGIPAGYSHTSVFHTGMYD